MEQKEVSAKENTAQAAKNPKTWEEAISELQGFIIRSKKEEAMKAEETDQKAE